ncbi:MAG TPA: L,D-transpeptidase [Vicinamibacteria bacterium]|nr:L,D-transpeptidase [Vicinamibacteria bacterium]
MSRRRSPRDDEDLGRRRSGWSEFREAYPRIVAGLAVFLGLLALADGFLVYKWVRYASETRRLRAAMTGMEKDRADTLLAAGESQAALFLEVARLQAGGESALNLAISLEDQRMYLQREGARLREMPVRIAPETSVGEAEGVVLAAPRGKRAVMRVVSREEAYELPAWAWTARGLPVPSRRSVAGALGPVALLLSGGTVIYSLPAAPPLDSADYVLPGSVRAEASDLEAILENVRPGMPVYFH